MAVTRYSIVEYGSYDSTIAQYAAIRSLSLAEAETVFRHASDRIQAALHLERTPLEVTSAGVRAKGIAGMVSLDADCELEIAPKYVGTASAPWQQDLLFISVLSRHGELLLQDQIGAGALGVNDLASFAAVVLLRLFYQNRRSPLKSYRFVTFSDFALEGDFEAEDLMLPDEEGFRQKTFSFNADNEYSATVAAGVRALLERVRDPQLASRLGRMLADLGPVSARSSSIRRKLSPRLRRWQLLYDLAFDLSRGLDLSPGDKLHSMPGFVINTWRTWEDLVTRALVLAFGYSAVAAQLPRQIGTSAQAGKKKPVSVKPDAVISRAHHAQIVVDAKYKGRGTEQFTGIEESDFYEALAFMQATGISTTLLLYPATEAISGSTGKSAIVEEITTAKGQTVLAACVEVNGIARRGGFLVFIEGIKKLVSSISAPTSVVPLALATHE